MDCIALEMQLSPKYLNDEGKIRMSTHRWHDSLALGLNPVDDAVSLFIIHRAQVDVLASLIQVKSINFLKYFYNILSFIYNWSM